jgi:biotin operon repressor
MDNLSIRKYALLIGCSHTAVAKAIKNGYIVKGWNTETKKIIVDAANSEWGNLIAEKNINTDPIPAKAMPFMTSYLSKNDNNQVSEEISFSEARRKKQIYDAEIARITALKEQGLYVEKEKVYSQLTEFGQIVRGRLQAIPNRVIDNILSAKTRNEAQLLLVTAIDEALESLTKPPHLR